MLETDDRDEDLGPRPPRAPRFRKRADLIADEIKQWIVREGLAPGDRLPQERALCERFGVSKGTMRETLAALEAQGLVQVSTGPKGGARIAKVPLETAARLLGNYFHFEQVSVDDLYALRLMLEPELAAEVTPRLSDEDIDALERLVAISDCVPEDRHAERGQRWAELDFHDLLAERCDNPLLRFACRFISALIKNGIVYQTLYEEDDPGGQRRAQAGNVDQMAADGIVAHRAIIDAFRARDPEAARAAMRFHMEQAYDHLRQMEARLTGGFLRG